MHGNETATVSDLRERGDVCIRCLDQMIGGGRAQFGRERRAAEVVKLVSVDLERESQRPGLRQDLTRLFKVKGFRFAEDIHKRQRQARGMRLPPFF